MASTNKTANLGLSQWEALDALTREDLNADFLKIDQASEAWGKETLLDVTVSQRVQALDLDISSFDMNNYTELEMYLDLNTPGMRNMVVDNFSEYSRLDPSASDQDNVMILGNLIRIGLSRKRAYITDNSDFLLHSIEDNQLPKISILHLSGSDTSRYFDKDDRIIIKGVRK